MVAADTIRSPIAKKSYLESKPAPTLEFNIKDWVSCQVTKSTPQETNIGLEFEYNPKDGNIYITKVYHLAHMFSDARVGDKLHKFFGKDAKEFSTKGEDGVKELYDIMKVETVISFETLHHEYTMNESVTEISMDVEIGDIVPLQNFAAKQEYNGHDVEVLRALKGNKYLVKVISNPKEKFIVNQDNLYYEVLVDQLVGKERVEEDDGDSKQQSHHVLLEQQEEEASSEEEDIINEAAEALEAVKFEEEEEERQRQLDEEHFQQYKSDMKTRMGC